MSRWVLLCAVACGSAEGKVDPMARLADQVAKLSADGDPKTLALPSGVTLSVEAPGFTLAFEPAQDAAALASAFGWKRPFAISPDVHQQTWIVHVFSKDIDDPNNHRIATEAPQNGVWAARAQLTARPEGKLPQVVAGASPAYDLAQYHAHVAKITFRPR